MKTHQTQTALTDISRPASFMPALGPALGRPSPIGQAAGFGTHKSQGHNSKKDMTTPLLLTALVDAFSILVIFLLVQVTASQAPFDPSETIHLPKASAVDGDKSAASGSLSVLSIENGQYVVDGKKVARQALAATLKAKREAVQAAGKSEFRLVIQADEKADADFMGPLLLATAEAQVSKLEFAVQEVDGTRTSGAVRSK